MAAPHPLGFRDRGPKILIRQRFDLDQIRAGSGIDSGISGLADLPGGLTAKTRRDAESSLLNPLS